MRYYQQYYVTRVARTLRFTNILDNSVIPIHRMFQHLSDDCFCFHFHPLAVCYQSKVKYWKEKVRKWSTSSWHAKHFPQECVGTNKVSSKFKQHSETNWMLVILQRTLLNFIQCHVNGSMWPKTQGGLHDLQGTGNALTTCIALKLCCIHVLNCQLHRKVCLIYF